MKDRIKFAALVVAEALGFMLALCIAMAALYTLAILVDNFT